MYSPTFAVVLASVVALATATSIQAQKLTDITPYLITDRGAEVSLARSAAPKDISDSATVLVMTRTGFVEAAHGTNGFTCVVLRSFSGNVDDPAFWNTRVRAPLCLNPPASKTVLPQILRKAESIIAGGEPKSVDEGVKRAYATHELPMPAAGSMVYMLSPRQYLLDSDPHWLPHLMFFYDRSLPPSAWGVGGASNTILDGSSTDKTFPVMTLLIPVREWSDGTPAIATSAKH